MKPDLNRIKQKLRSGDVSQDVLNSLAKAVPIEGDFDEIVRDMQEKGDSFHKVADKIRDLEAIINSTKHEEIKPKVRFIDFDGTIVVEVGIDELPLAKMPEAPDHSNDFVPLSFIGWTTTLTKINSSKHSLDVGAQYKAADGNMHLVIDIAEGDIEGGDNVFEIKFKPVSEDIVIDWGNGENATIPAYVPESEDAPAPDPIARSVTYSEAGQYDIIVSSDAENIPLWFDVFQSGNKVRECVIGCNVEEIQNVFSSCYSMRSLVIPDNVKVIGDYAFSSCNSLQCLVIPNSVTSINLTNSSSGTFTSCYSLQHLVIPDSVTSIGIYAFYYCYSLQSLVVPGSVTTLGASAFYYCYTLHSLVINEGVKDMNANVFQSCYSLHNLVIPNSVTSIGHYSFYNCYSLSSLTIGKGIKYINTDTFSYCYKLQRLEIPDNVISIADSSFRYCYSLKSLVLGRNLQTLTDYAFQYCYSLQRLVVKSEALQLNNYAFQYCYSLQDLSFEEGVRTIGRSVFSECRTLRNLVIPDSVTEIGDGAFQYCDSLQNLKLGKNVQRIYDNAFNHSYFLYSLEIPESVIYIASGAFSSCYGLKKLVFNCKGATINSLAFSVLCNATVYTRTGENDFFNTKFKDSTIIYDYGRDVVGFGIANNYVRKGSEILLKVEYFCKDVASEDDHVFSKDDLVITCSDNAALEDGWLRPLEESGTVTVTVSANDGSGYSATKEIEIIEPSVSIDLNDGQWVETEEEVNGHTVYKSDAGSYNISKGESLCTIDVFGYKKLKITGKLDNTTSYNNYNDYIALGNINGTVSRTSKAGQIPSTTYTSYTYTFPDQYRHNTVQILYTKSSTKTSGNDRGYFYFEVE